MKKSHWNHALVLTAFTLAGAAVAQVQTSGKVDVDMADVPAAVMAVAREAGPDLEFNQAQREERNDQVYWDIEGEGPDGMETEFDITQVDGQWAVVETQRDIGMERVPSAVSAALSAADAGFRPGRIIESVQADGLVIYEFFGGEDAGLKHEVSWDGEAAAWLEQEWVH